MAGKEPANGERMFSNKTNAAYKAATPAADFDLPDGWYRFRSESAEFKMASTSRTEALAIKLRCVDQGRDHIVLRRDFWLSDKSNKYVKRDLHTLGFGDLDLDQILKFKDFDRLPIVRARIAHREFEGRTRPELVEFRKDEGKEEEASSDGQQQAAQASVSF